MAITVLKHHVPWGPFTRLQITHGLERGDFTLSYLAHTPGLKDWLPLGEVLDFYDRHASLPPLPGDRLPPVPGPRRLTAFLSPATSSQPAHARRRPRPHRRPPPRSAPTRRRADISRRPRLSPGAKGRAYSHRSRPRRFPPRPAPCAVLSRFFAFAIDIIVLFLPVIFLFALGALTVFIHNTAEHADPETRGQDWALLFRQFEDLLFLVGTGGAWLYAVCLECSRWQATVGKQWIGIQVVDAHGRRLGFFRATARHAAKYLSALPCFLGFTAAFFSRRGLALHDRLAGTRVTRKPKA